MLIKCIKSLLPQSLKRAVKFVLIKEYRKDVMIRRKFAEKKISLGNENPNLTFYIIRTPYGAGIFSSCAIYLPYIIYAKKKGYIPIIDELNYHNCLLDGKYLKKINTWELFFEQPGGYSLDAISKSKNIILCNGLELPPNCEAVPWVDFDLKKDSQKWNNEFLEHIQFHEDITREIAEKTGEILPSNTRVMGFAVRRGIARCQELQGHVANGHPVEGSIESIVEEIQQGLEKYSCDYVYCTSDDEEAINILRNCFKEKLVYLRRTRYSYYKNQKVQCFDNCGVYGIDKINLTREYIVETAILAKCTVLCGSDNGGTVMARIWNDGEYEAVNVGGKGIWKPTENKKQYLNEFVAINGMYYIT